MKVNGKEQIKITFHKHFFENILNIKNDELRFLGSL